MIATSIIVVSVALVVVAAIGPTVVVRAIVTIVAAVVVGVLMSHIKDSLLLLSMSIFILDGDMVIICIRDLRPKVGFSRILLMDVNRARVAMTRISSFLSGGFGMRMSMIV